MAKMKTTKKRWLTQTRNRTYSILQKQTSLRSNILFLKMSRQLHPSKMTLSWTSTMSLMKTTWLILQHLTKFIGRWQLHSIRQNKRLRLILHLKVQNLITLLRSNCIWRKLTAVSANRSRIVQRIGLIVKSTRNITKICLEKKTILTKQRVNQLIARKASSKYWAKSLLMPKIRLSRRLRNDGRKTRWRSPEKLVNRKIVLWMLRIKLITHLMTRKPKTTLF